eukprot:7545207-Pyramimonas_sp.AAC.1
MLRPRDSQQRKSKDPLEPLRDQLGRAGRKKVRLVVVTETLARAKETKAGTVVRLDIKSVR